MTLREYVEWMASQRCHNVHTALPAPRPIGCECVTCRARTALTGPVAPPREEVRALDFEQWWLDFAKRPESDVLDDFTLDEQAKIAGIVRDAWAALAATPTLRVQP